MRVLAAALVALAGCYQPNPLACTWQCDPTGACPSGLQCNDQSMCVAAPGDRCGMPVDAPPLDVPVALDGPPVVGLDCWTASNKSPCDVQPNNGVHADWTINSPTIVDGGSITGAQPDGGYQQASDAQLTVILVRNFKITGNGSLSITGASPVIILVNGAASISGPVDVVPAVIDAWTCGSGVGGAAGGTSTGVGAGGGGGSFGLVSGGDGGSDGLAQAGGAGSAEGEPTLVPLRGGCAGGAGGFNLSASAPVGRAGGAGGGALQISAFGSLTIGASINVPGQPGDLSGPAVGGGGGGGAGGGLLLEAPVVMLKPGAAICADGAGGGGGGNTPTTQVGGASDCTAPPMPAAGGGSASGGTGAAGAQRGGDGTPGNGASGFGGGGGGGGEGRIRINTNSLLPIANISPAPSFASWPPP